MARPTFVKMDKPVPGLRLDGQGRYWVSIELRFGPGEKAKRVERVVGSKAQALRYLTKIKEEARMAHLFPEERAAEKQSGITIADLCERYREIDENTNKDHAGHAAMEAAWIRLLGKDMLWHELTIEQIAAQQAAWLREGLSPGRINRYTTRLHAVLHKAAKQRVIRHNPIAGYVRLQEPRARRRKLEDVEEPRLRAELLEWQWDFVEFAILSGFRQEEQFGCRVEYVDTRANTISLPETKTTARKHEGRTIPMSAKLRGIVERQIALGSEWLFPNVSRTNAMLADNFMSDYHRMALKRAGIKGLRWHDYRRTCASRLHRLGWSIAAIQKYLGHKHSATTDRYIAVSDPELAELVKRQDGGEWSKVFSDVEFETEDF